MGRLARRAFAAAVHQSLSWFDIIQYVAYVIRTCRITAWLCVQVFRKRGETGPQGQVVVDPNVTRTRPLFINLRDLGACVAFVSIPNGVTVQRSSAYTNYFSGRTISNTSCDASHNVVCRIHNLALIMLLYHN